MSRTKWLSLILGIVLAAVFAWRGLSSSIAGAIGSDRALFLPVVAGGAGQDDGATHVCGTLTGHRTWSQPVYTLTCPVTIPAGASLTIEPDVTVQFAAPGPFSLTVLGRLTAQGAPDRPVRFQSAAALPAPGQWGSLQILPGGIVQMSYAEVRHGGAGNSAQLQVVGGSAELDTVTFRDGMNGISAQDTSLILRHSDISDHTGYGLRLTALNTPTLPTLLGNTFNRNGSYPALLLLDAGGLGHGISRNRGSGNGRFDGIYLQGRLTTASTLAVNHPGFPYVIGDLRLEPGVNLSLEPGLVLKFGALTGSLPARGTGRLTIAGALSGNGRSDAPLFFTSFWDDAAGYDTNRDGVAAQPQPGDWLGLRLEPGGQMTVSYARVSYAGAPGQVAAIDNAGNLTAANLKISHSAGHGLAGDGAFDLTAAYITRNAGDGLHVSGPGSLADSSLLDNGGYAVYNDYDDGSGVYRLNATANYWGAADGPADDQATCFHNDLPTGSGGLVNCAVDWSPFVTSTPRISVPASPKKGLSYWNRPTVALEPPWELGWYTRYALSDLNSLRKQNPGAVFVPLMWCDHPKNDPTASSLQEMLDLYGPDYSGYVIWVNEPELGAPYNQCDLTNVYEAAQYYIDTKSALPQAKLVGTNNAFDANITPYTLSWLNNWRAAVLDLTCNHPSPLPCGYPEMYAYGMHLFGESAALNLQLLDQYYGILHNNWGIADPRIWVTEMTFCMNNPAHAQEMADTIFGFESRAFLERYSFWTNRSGNDNYIPPPPNGRCFLFSYLMDPFTGWTTPTLLGTTYRSLPYNYSTP